MCALWWWSSWANVTTYKHINKSEILLFASTNREYLYVFIFVYISQR